MALPHRYAERAPAVSLRSPPRPFSGPWLRPSGPDLSGHPSVPVCRSWARSAASVGVFPRCRRATRSAGRLGGCSTPPTATVHVASPTKPQAWSALGGRRPPPSRPAVLPWWLPSVVFPLPELVRAQLGQLVIGEAVAWSLAPCAADVADEAVGSFEADVASVASLVHKSFLARSLIFPVLPQLPSGQHCSGATPPFGRSFRPPYVVAPRAQATRQMDPLPPTLKWSVSWSTLRTQMAVESSTRHPLSRCTRPLGAMVARSSHAFVPARCAPARAPERPREVRRPQGFATAPGDATSLRPALAGVTEP